MVQAAGPKPTTLIQTVPPTVSNGQATRVGRRAQDEVVGIAVGLKIRAQDALLNYVHALNDPTSPLYHRSLSQEEVNNFFNPTADQEKAVEAWLQKGGMQVTRTYPNHLLIDAQGTIAQIESLLHITLNTYSGPVHGVTRTFMAPDRDPQVDASVSTIVDSVVGLDTVPRFHKAFTNGIAHASTPYYPQDFANAYNLKPLWDAGYTGANQNIAITLWETPPSPSTLTHFHTTTGADVATIANKRLTVIPVDGGTSYADDGEAGMDIEYSSGMAPGANINYYEIPTDPYGNPTDQGLLDALNRAGTDPMNNREISSSWGGCEASASDPWQKQAENILAANTATGHSYFFASGDNGSWCDPNNTGTGIDPWPNYPASSPNVVSVGGTSFNQIVNSATYPGENVWPYCHSCSNGAPEGTGGGFSKVYSRPAWQTARGLPTNSFRGYPDIAADADPYTGAQVCYGNADNPAFATCDQFGGTSLSTPMWAGITAVLNQYVMAQGKPAIAFLSKALYGVANGSQAFPAFHDVTAGTNGKYSAGAGWDAVTGLGAPNVWNLARDLVSVGGSGPGPSFTLNPSSGAPGTRVTVTAGGLAPNDSAVISWESATGQRLSTASASPTGTFSRVIVIPPAAYGTHYVVVSGSSGASTMVKFDITSKVALSRPAGTSGMQVTAMASGFNAGALVTFHWSSPTGPVLGQARADNNGTVPAVSTTIPASPAGTYYVWALNGLKTIYSSAPFTVTASLRFSPNRGPVGTTATAIGTGFNPGERVTIFWNCGSASACSGVTPLATGTADGSGTLSNLKIVIPQNASPATMYVLGVQAQFSPFTTTYFAVLSS